MRNAVAVAIPAVSLALVAACSSVSTDHAPGEPPVQRSSWVAQELPVHTRLSATKDSIVYGGVQEKKLYVVALDPATGKQRWRLSSAVSGRNPGVEQTILTDDDTAYFLAEHSWGQIDTDLIAVATATGAERWRTSLAVQSAQPGATPCGDSICIVVARCDCNSPDLMQFPHTEIWRLAKTDGRIMGYYSIAGDAGHGDVVLNDPRNSADAVLVASFGTVYVSQFLHFGESKAWSKPAAELFGPTTVTLNGGWGGWRVADGWIAYVGTRRDEGKLKAGDVIASGVTAGFDDRGKSRWIAAARHPCAMFRSDAEVTLCDGEWRMVSAEQSDIRPHVAEGRDPTTGAVNWKLDLNGEINENDGEKVVRIDDDHYLVDLSTGPVALDLRHGPGPSPKEPTSGWCTPQEKAEKIGGMGQSFRRVGNPFPCRLGGEQVGPSLPIPEFAGVNVAGWGAWVEDDHVHAKHLEREPRKQLTIDDDDSAPNQN